MAQVATRLLLDVKRSTGLPPYAEEMVRDIVGEITALHHDSHESLRKVPQDSSGQEQTAIIVQTHTLRRNKRCLVVYHTARCERIEALRWNTGTVLPAASREAMSKSEVDYFKAYGSALTQYLEATGSELTLHQKPPKWDRIHVKALCDCGTVQTCSGPRLVAKGETHLMARADAEALVRRGMLVQVSWE